MAVSDDLEFLALTEAATQKATMVNTALSQVEGALSGELTIDCSAGGTIDLPYDNSNDLSDRRALHNMLVTLTGAPAAAFTIRHPNKRHLFFCRNESGQSATIRTVDNASPNVALADTAAAVLYCDGTGIELLATSGAGGSITVETSATPYDFQFSMFGKMFESDQVIGQAIALRAVTFPADFAGSVIVAGTLPTELNAIFVVKDDGVEIGQIAIQSDGNTTYQTTDGTSKAVAAGSILTVEAPSTVDDTLADVQIAIAGSLT